MKLFDIDKLIEASKPMQALAGSVKELASAVERVASNLAIIAHNQQVHHQMINQLWGVQRAVFKKLSEASLDLSLPEIDVVTDDQPASDGARRSKPKPKPN